MEDFERVAKPRLLAVQQAIWNQATFRPGQFFERPWPMGWTVSSRGALGRSGCGSERPPNVEEIRVHAGHSDYWPEPIISERITAELEGKTRLDDLCRPVEMRRISLSRQIIYRVVDGRRLSSDRYAGLRAHCDPKCD